MSLRVATAIAVLALGCRGPADFRADARVAVAISDARPPTPPPDAAPPCAPAASATAPTALTDTLTLAPAAFTDLPGWADDHHAEAVPSFLASCAVIAKLADDALVGADGQSGHARDWRAACAAAARVPAGDDAAARAFFETQFRAYTALSKTGPDGKMTAYDVQHVHASRTKHGAYVYPIYGYPPDLVQVDLGKFVSDSGGRRLWGRIDPRTHTLVDYPTRAEIRKGALAGQHLELLWSDDEIDVLYAQIEGSARATLDDGSEAWLEFAGKNGRGYRGVGKLLRDSGELAPGQGTMQGIRAWFVAHPDRRDEIIDQDTSMVFFKLADHPGAVGSEGVILTPRRSLAIDRAYVAHGTPIWIDTRAPVPGQKHEEPWRHLAIAQDTGGGIIGPVRADIYMGDDDVASELGGRMGGPGRYWLLLPRSVKILAN